MISRAIMEEILAGNGARGDRRIDDYVFLDATHLGKNVIEAKLPDIAEFCRTYLGLDPADQPMPIQPTAHYAMGGIPTDLDGRVLGDERGTVIEGLYAAGECACVSVHGANRLGTNSLVDLVVFGRRAGLDIERYVQGASLVPLGDDPAGPARERLAELKDGKKGPHGGEIRGRMRDVMMEKVGIYRKGPAMAEAVAAIARLRQEYRAVRAQDSSSRRFNTDVLEILELGNLLDLALVTAQCAQARRESRGGHAREDYPQRDDEGWLKHTLAWLEGDRVRLGYKPVDVSVWQPKPRTY
jgi:succinate dehydrogenase / fumarate reductase flavoprotein subunit